MKRRFVVALLAVAIAAIGTMAQAMAPTIVEVPSPVIADEDVDATGSNDFVYPDAFDLDQLATDDSVQPSEIIWSYQTDADYQINGKASLDLSTDDPVSPGAKRIDNSDDDPNSEDSNTRTITLRDSQLSPIGGPNASEDGLSSGVVRSGVVTLFASDGTTASMEEVLFYTENNGRDRISSGLANEVTIDMTQGIPPGWSSSTVIGSPTMSQGGNGLCIQVGTTGDHFGQWVSPYGIVDLGKNKVYRVRFNLSSTANLPPSTTPLWSFVIDNVGSDNGVEGASKFAGEFLNLDAEEGANSAGLSSGGRNDFQFWYTPAQVNAASWNDSTSGAFTPANEGRNDLRFTYRILDVEGGTNGQNRSGTLCMSTLVVDSMDIGAMQVSSTPFNVTDINAGNYTVDAVISDANTNANFSGGAVTITPNTTSAWDLEVVDIFPGDTTSDLGQPASLPDNYPITWQSNQLLKVSTGISAPDSTGETNPPDALEFIVDVPSVELLSKSNVQAGANILGMPKQGQVTEYVQFFYTHNVTGSSITNADRIRPRTQLLNTGAINTGGTISGNQGGVTVTSQRVDVMQTP